MAANFPLRDLYQFLLSLSMYETARSSIAMSTESAIKLLDYCQSEKLKMAFEVALIFGTFYLWVGRYSMLAKLSEGTQVVRNHTSAMWRRPVWEKVNHSQWRDRKHMMEGPWIQTRQTPLANDTLLDFSWFTPGFCWPTSRWRVHKQPLQAPAIWLTGGPPAAWSGTRTLIKSCYIT